MKYILNLLFAAIILTATTSTAQTPPDDPPVAAAREGYWADVLAHDPVLAREGDTWYLFITGPGISVYSSKNLDTWKAEPQVFAQIPQWAFAIAPNFNGHIWAPDISHHNGVYFLYYSISAFGKNTSAIGVATNTTLNPDHPAFHWVDHGPILRSIPQRDLWNAIDPNLALDEHGTPWLAFGSFWGGLKLVRLSDDRLHLAEPQQWYTLAKRERSILVDDAEAMPAALEAPFIFRQNGWYYLFLSWDACCRGVESTYRIMVGRSRSVHGPYLDKAGQRLDQGGGSEVLRGTQRWPGVGHNSAYTFDGKDYLIFHAYDAHDNGLPKLKVLPLSWDEDGWPEVDAAALQ